MRRGERDGGEKKSAQREGRERGRTISKKSLCEILEARAEECYQLIKKKLDESGQMEQLGAGIVVTGGASQLNGFVEMGEFMFDLPVRRGMPQKIGGLTDVVKSSQFSTAVGLLIYGEKQIQKQTKTSKGVLCCIEVFCAWRSAQLSETL